SAGYTKIHIDTSMKLNDDDKHQILSANVVAKRGARLAKVCEEAFQKLQQHTPCAMHPVYVIGSEVPVPGGSKETEEICVTKSIDFENTFNIFKEEFEKNRVDTGNIVAVVVQPGVEFSNEYVQYYKRENAKELCLTKQKYPDIVFEGHSSDYQTKYNLHDMVQDGIAILKVGPALTFAMREGLFALSNIEKELIVEQDKQAHFIETLEKAMLDNPRYWQGYYAGTNEQMRFARKYGLSDRCRYYFAVPEVEKSIEKLIDNLDKAKIPLALISQYLPQQYRAVIEGDICNNAKSLLLDKIGALMDDYVFAVQGKEYLCY
ncbi:MAG: class II D-tagatose-bisphosphate aldolase, non-catalytic subunit, partial [Oscillospiraceae bacterium]